MGNLIWHTAGLKKMLAEAETGIKKLNEVLEKSEEKEREIEELEFKIATMEMDLLAPLLKISVEERKKREAEIYKGKAKAAKMRTEELVPFSGVEYDLTYRLGEIDNIVGKIDRKTMKQFDDEDDRIYDKLRDMLYEYSWNRM